MMLHDNLAVAWGENVTTAQITRKELDRLLDLAKERGRTVENRRKGDHDNFYIDDRLFAGRDRWSCYLVIAM